MAAKALTALRAALPGDLAFSALVVSVVALLVVPLPTLILDLLLTANIGLSVVLLLTALYIRSALQFSTFPSVLLVATLLRLALNVSSTRLILSQADAGRVIEAFGAFVVRGNYVVGAVIFIILTVIQFLVIAKGSERVAEVAARFTLDAMPGKQMAIDADLRAGAFTLPEARRRRQELARESQLFGAMDGAMKFVKGDAVAGIVIALVNICGGLIIGVVQRDMPAAEAAQVYTLLTIGDGLVSQIPALITSIAAGLIVTRVGDGDRDLGSEVLDQLTATPRVFGIAAGLLAALGLVPGLPMVPFLALAACAGVVARVSTDRRRARARDASDAEALVAAPSSSEREEPQVMAVSALTVELGLAASDTVKGADGDDAVRAEIRGVRDAVFQRLGVKVPAVRVRFSMVHLPADAVRVSVYEVAEVEGVIPSDRRACVATPADLRARGVDAEPVTHPVTGAQMSLVPVAQAVALAASGTPVLTPSQLVMVYVGAAIHRRAERFIGLAEVQAALDQIEGSHAALVDAVVPRVVSLAMLTGVLKRLVGEGVPIRDLRAILEALAEDATEGMDVVELTELARVGLARAITARIAPSGVLRGLLVDHAIEQAVRDGIRREAGKKPRLSIPPRITTEILEAFRPYLAGDGPKLVVASQDVRRFLRQLLALEHANLVVLGLSELHDGVRFETAGTVAAGRAPAG